MNTAQTQLIIVFYVMSELLEAHIPRANTQTAPGIVQTSFVCHFKSSHFHIVHVCVDP